jgi:ribosomal-protein-alanine N-acetyltransferase
MPGWTIELLSSPDEIDEVLAVERASFTNPWTREMYLSELQNEGVSFLFVARDETRRLIGFCSVWLVFDEIHINNLAVAPAHRRQGIAASLLTHVLAQAPRLGATRALLEVRRSNGEALRLYERFRFSVAGTRRNYYSHPVEDALVLWREALGTD